MGKPIDAFAAPVANTATLREGTSGAAARADHDHGTGSGGGAVYQHTVNTASAGSTYTIPAVTVADWHLLTLTAHTAFTFPTPTAGQIITVALVQDSTGSWAPSWPSNVRWPNGVAPTIGGSANLVVAVIDFECFDGTYWLGLVRATNFSISTAVTLLSDSFNRADSTTSLGSADTGQAWVVLNGTCGINGNRAYHTTSSSQDYAVVDLGQSDVTISLKIYGDIANGGGITFRAVDVNNLWFVDVDSSGSSLYKVVAGSFTQVATAMGAFTIGDTMSVVLSGTSVIVKRNSTTIHSSTQSQFSTATKHGLRLYGTSARLEDVLVTQP